jgi:molybdopterin-guanine dinucleotide biosynthesis protein A
MPGIAATQLSWTANQLIERPNLMGVLLSRDTEGGRQVEPFPSAYRCSPATAAMLVSQLKRQRRAVRSLLDFPNFAAVDAPKEWPARTWLNLNTPADLKAFLGQTQAD